MRGWPAVLVAVGCLGVAHGRTARACSPISPPPPSAIPRTGATGVSTETSIVVVLPREPFGVSVTADGQPVPVSGWRGLGSGIDSRGGATGFWQLTLGMLAPSADYIVTLPNGAQDGGSTTLTSFSTAAGYDKKGAGTTINLRGFHLWRVRYPVADIASGNCVFAEYHSFVTVDYDLPALPNTPPGSLIQTFQLTPETGGTTQTFVYTGETPFAGWAPMSDYPTPSGQWQPDLDPTRRYCLTISAIGDDDLANLGAASNRLCTDVVQLSATGAPPPPDLGGTDGGSTRDAGAPSPRDAGTTAGSSGGGCSISGGTAGWLGLATLFAAIGLAFARRRQRRTEPPT
ncbi:MAG: hypothetical protein ACJ8F1_08590 [Polyangia bacterium]